MNTVKIMGGLGNQLFQYAFAKSLQIKTGVPAMLDTTYYDSEFNKRPDIAHREFLLPHFADDLMYEVGGYIEQVNQWEYDKNKDYQGVLFFGDWQKVSFFHGLPLGIEQKSDGLTENAYRIADQMEKENSIAIHVRRTDYKSLGWALDNSYYQRAVEEIKKRVENPVFYIFSDDIIDYIPGCVLHYTHIDTLNDFWLMSNCKHNIIANSTYSFWAAYLNENENIVIYPNDWKCPSPIDVELDGWIGV